MEEIDIIQQVKDSQEMCDKLSVYLDENFMIEGKTIRDWKKHFWINILADIKFSDIVKLGTEVSKKYQEAAFYREKGTISLNVLEQTQADRYNIAYQQTRSKHEEEYGKTLAARSCEVSAELAIKAIKDAVAHQKVARDFWNRTCDTLVEVRKILEMHGKCLATDIRAERDFVFQAKKEN